MRETSAMRVAAVIVAAGRGERAGGGIPKQFRRIAGRTVIGWSIRAFADANVEPIVVVAAPDRLPEPEDRNAGVIVVPGGETRTASVRNGLAALAARPPDVVLIHDAARPGLRAEMVRALVAQLNAGALAAAPSLPLSDALKRVDETGRLLGEHDRSSLLRVQTPQAFAYSLIWRAYGLVGGRAFDDDLAVARAAGAEATLIPGDPRLMKLTFPEDFPIMEAILGGHRAARVGTGFDAHRFGAGDHVTLCGVRIAHDKGLLGHSDADVGWHALVDAILGAIGAGDIGQHFPPSDPQWAGADSELFLRHAAKLVGERSGRIVHVDVTLICERPKVAPYREAMRARTAEVLALPPDRVSVKATTTERLGFLGREEGLAAQAAATVEMPA
ncbi:MAG TPA: bifunctional 2-C-methyl-D-erythritol 4-phosphate cytidylyltransferase/2-C-methyl-D-erythritol 2,4-cyclodiphosphate synthase [Caulobacterales bacterium]|nr:bifunctional 2-C-methyl-D-erythritol 4-phosphate cytidylyltransferase/2-C-methyl-D-erythritol 2,4-cyclodiphosphate synthase [Caulobacterales bacterium]